MAYSPLQRKVVIRRVAEERVEEVKRNLFKDVEKQEPVVRRKRNRNRNRRRREQSAKTEPLPPVIVQPPPAASPARLVAVASPGVRTIVVGEVPEPPAKVRILSPPSPAVSVCSFGSGVNVIQLSPPPATPEPVRELEPAPEDDETPLVAHSPAPGPECNLPCCTPPRQVQLQPEVEVRMEPAEVMRDAVAVIHRGSPTPPSLAWRLIPVDVPERTPGRVITRWDPRGRPRPASPRRQVLLKRPMVIPPRWRGTGDVGLVAL